MSILPNLVLNEIAYRLKVPDLINFRATCSRFNNIFNEYFWTRKLQQDFNVNIKEKAFDTFIKVWTGQLMVYEKLVPIENFRKRLNNWYTKVGLLVLLEIRCETRRGCKSLYVYYHDNWSEKHEYWSAKLDEPGVGIEYITDEKIMYLFNYYRGRKFYISPNKLDSWNIQFKPSTTYEYKKYLEIFKRYIDFEN